MVAGNHAGAVVHARALEGGLIPGAGDGHGQVAVDQHGAGGAEGALVSRVGGDALVAGGEAHILSQGSGELGAVQVALNLGAVLVDDVQALGGEVGHGSVFPALGVEAEALVGAVLVLDGHLLGGLDGVVPGPVSGGIGHAVAVEDVLVVEQAQGVVVANQVVLLAADVAEVVDGFVHLVVPLGIIGDQLVQGQGHAGAHPLVEVALTGGEDVVALAGGEGGQQAIAVAVAGNHVGDDLDVVMLGIELVDHHLLGIILLDFAPPGHTDGDLLAISAGHGGHAAQHSQAQNQSNQFLHVGTLLKIFWTLFAKTFFVPGSNIAARRGAAGTKPFLKPRSCCADTACIPAQPSDPGPTRACAPPVRPVSRKRFCLHARPPRCPWNRALRTSKEQKRF